MKHLQYHQKIQEINYHLIIKILNQILNHHHKEIQIQMFLFYMKKIKKQIRIFNHININ
jgi:hypothetical protein